MNLKTLLSVPKLFYLFLGWTALCCFMSPWPALSVYGFHLRYEGLLTYLLCAILACEYWNHFHSARSILLPVGILCLIYPFSDYLFGKEWVGWFLVPQVAIAGMCAVAFGICYSASRLLSVPIAIAGVWTGSRAFFVCMVLVIILTEWPNFARKQGFKWFLLVFALLIACIAPFTPLAVKLKNTRFNFTGSRSQWIQQAYTISKALPLTGYGLDTGSEWLRPAKGATAEDREVIADRTHNLFMDVLVWTGWIGLFLFITLLGSIAWTVYQFRSEENIYCALGILSYVTFNLFNPSGAPALALFFICILGVRRKL